MTQFTWNTSQKVWGCQLLFRQISWWEPKRGWKVIALNVVVILRAPSQITHKSKSGPPLALCSLVQCRPFGEDLEDFCWAGEMLMPNSHPFPDILRKIITCFDIWSSVSSVVILLAIHSLCVNVLEKPMLAKTSQVFLLFYFFPGKSLPSGWTKFQKRANVTWNHLTSSSPHFYGHQWC